MEGSQTTAGMIMGYARVSTLEQDESLQRDALNAAGCERIFVDKASGKLASRPALDQMLEQLRAGDRFASAHVHETADQVTVTVKMRRVHRQCAAAGLYGPVTLLLDRPLGDRRVVDGGTGQRVPVEQWDPLFGDPEPFLGVPVP
jgi:hypothetical protein